MPRSLVLILCLFLSGPSGASQPSPGDAEARAREAWEALSANQLPRAMSLYRQLVESFPEVPTFRMNLGVAAFLSQEHNEAIRELSQALRNDPSLTPAYLYLGASHLQAGNRSEGISALGEFLLRKPGDPGALQMLGDALLTAGRFEEAAERFETLCRIDPESPEAWYGRMRSCKALAAGAFARLEETAPESAYWFRLMGVARTAQNLQDHAFFFFRKALEKQPGMRGIYAAMSRIYETTGHPEWAQQAREKEQELPAPDCQVEKLECQFQAGHFQEVVASARSQKTSGAYYWRALALEELAEQAFARLQALPPSYLRHRAAAEAHQQRGQGARAATEWRKALELSPGEPAAVLGLVQALMSTRDYNGAWTLVGALLRDQPDSRSLYPLAGEILLNLQRPAEAIPWLVRALEDRPDDLQVRASLGSAYLSGGEAARAIPYLKAALRADEDGSRHYQLARAYQSQGEAALATEVLRQRDEILEAGRIRKEQVESELEITPP